MRSNHSQAKIRNRHLNVRSFQQQSFVQVPGDRRQSARSGRSCRFLILRVEVVLEFLSAERHHSVINHFKSDESTSRRDELRLFRTQWSADALLAFIKNFLVPILDCLVTVHKNRRRSVMAALGHEPSFTMTEILTDERLLSAVLLPVGDVTAVT